MAMSSLAGACLGMLAAAVVSMAGTVTAEAHGLDHGWGRYPARGHHWHHHQHRAHGHVHKVTRKARPSRAVSERYRAARWHCNPWHGSAMLHGQRFVLGKGLHYGVCLEHQTHVAKDWRMWREHDRARGRVHWHSHREHHWLKNADLRRRVR